MCCQVVHFSVINLTINRLVALVLRSSLAAKTEEEDVIALNWKILMRNLETFEQQQQKLAYRVVCAWNLACSFSFSLCGRHLFE
jgi:hypothetical protein